jgi:hypothetical protein
MGVFIFEAETHQSQITGTPQTHHRHTISVFFMSSKYLISYSFIALFTKWRNLGNKQSSTFMARITDGAIGPFVGSLGDITRSSWRGISYVKRRTKKRKKRGTKEKYNQSKFSMAHFWLQPVLDFVREGFKDYSQRSTGFNAAKSYLLKNALEGTAPDFSINPALVKVSAGNLPLPSNIAAEKAGDDEIRFTWDTTDEFEYRWDNVMMLAYNVEKRHSFSRTIGEFRYKGSDNLPVFPGLKYHLYLAFNAADRTKKSDSVYLGEMQM